MSGAVFVKSATTTTSVAKTQADIMAMLGRYGASGFGFRRRGSVAVVTFHIPREVKDFDSIGGEYTVEIPVDVDAVLASLKLYAIAQATRTKQRRKQYDAAQAERVAWRVLYLWVDAALAAVSIGAQSLRDAFFAHMVVETTDGQRGRLADYFAAMAGDDPRQRLPAPPAGRRLLSHGE